MAYDNTTGSFDAGEAEAYLNIGTYVYNIYLDHDITSCIDSGTGSFDEYVGFWCFKDEDNFDTNACYHESVYYVTHNFGSSYTATSYENWSETDITITEPSNDEVQVNTQNKQQYSVSLGCGGEDCNNYWVSDPSEISFNCDKWKDFFQYPPLEFINESFQYNVTLDVTNNSVTGSVDSTECSAASGSFLFVIDDVDFTVDIYATNGTDDIIDESHTWDEQLFVEPASRGGIEVISAKESGSDRDINFNDSTGFYEVTMPDCSGGTRSLDLTFDIDVELLISVEGIPSPFTPYSDEYTRCLTEEITANVVINAPT
jgi:hypothetical protein